MFREEFLVNAKSCQRILLQGAISVKMQQSLLKIMHRHQQEFVRFDKSPEVLIREYELILKDEYDILKNWETISINSTMVKVSNVINSVYRSLKPDLKDLLEMYDDNTRFIITGYSIGGAMASLFALAMNEEVHGALWQNPRSFLITFGQPRVGDEAYADIHDKIISSWRKFRFIYNRDPVVKIPPKWSGWKHHSRAIYLGHEKTTMRKLKRKRSRITAQADSSKQRDRLSYEEANYDIQSHISTNQDQRSNFTTNENRRANIRRHHIEAKKQPLSFSNVENNESKHNNLLRISTTNQGSRFYKFNGSNGSKRRLGADEILKSKLNEVTESNGEKRHQRIGNILKAKLNKVTEPNGEKRHQRIDNILKAKMNKVTEPNADKRHHRTDEILKSKLNEVTESNADIKYHRTDEILKTKLNEVTEPNGEKRHLGADEVLKSKISLERHPFSRQMENDDDFVIDDSSRSIDGKSRIFDVVDVFSGPEDSETVVINTNESNNQTNENSNASGLTQHKADPRDSKETSNNTKYIKGDMTNNQSALGIGMEGSIKVYKGNTTSRNDVYDVTDVFSGTDDDETEVIEDLNNLAESKDMDNEKAQQNSTSDNSLSGKEKQTESLYADGTNSEANKKEILTSQGDSIRKIERPISSFNYSPENNYTGDNMQLLADSNSLSDITERPLNSTEWSTDIMGRVFDNTMIPSNSTELSVNNRESASNNLVTPLDSTKKPSNATERPLNKTEWTQDFVDRPFNNTGVSSISASVPVYDKKSVSNNLETALDNTEKPSNVTERPLHNKELTPHIGDIIFDNTLLSSNSTEVPINNRESTSNNLETTSDKTKKSSDQSLSTTNSKESTTNDSSEDTDLFIMDNVEDIVQPRTRFLHICHEKEDDVCTIKYENIIPSMMDHSLQKYAEHLLKGPGDYYTPKGKKKWSLEEAILASCDSEIES